MSTTAVPRGGAIPLFNDTLGAHAGRVDVPAYDRSAITPGVVHFGVGGFHRAHQAVYLDDLADRGLTRDWGVVGVSMRSPRMREALAPQDWLYTVAERDEMGERARVVGILDRVLFAPEDPSSVLSALAAPSTRIVSLTITGGAYEARAAGSRSDVFGLIAEGLSRRRRSGLPPFTVVSCDNVPGNGRVARDAVLRAAAARDGGLMRWISANASFPSSVVDRITPKTSPQTRDQLRDEFGIDDRWPVVAEPFTQWIIEDNFSAGRPPLDEVGVRFVNDVGVYERMKKRLLNGGHSALAHLGILAGYERTDQAMADGAIRDYLSAAMRDEIVPLLDSTPDIDLGEYCETLLERFANPGVGDQLARLSERGSVKMRAYLLPSVEDALAEGRPFDLLALAVAGWLRFLRGTDLDGRRIDVVDPMRGRLMALARSGGSDPRPLLSEREVFGDLAEHERFIEAVGRHLETIEREGVRAALARAELPLVA